MHETNQFLLPYVKLINCIHTGFYLGSFVWGEAISPQVNKLFLAKNHRSTQGGGELEVFGRKLKKLGG